MLQISPVYQDGFLAGRASGHPFKRSIASNPCPLWSEAWNQWRRGFNEGSKKALTSAGYGRKRQRSKGVDNGQRKD